MTLRQFLAFELVIFLGTSSAGARPAVLGVVVEADRVHVNSGEVSTGATIYDGDQFSTEPGGMLLLRGDAMTLELAEESTMLIRSRTNGALGAEAELSKGTLIFSTERAAALGITALGARIDPSADVRTIAQITIAEPNELRIYARRGALQFSYRGETETIAERSAFRVILDPSEDQPKKAQTIKPGHQRKAFLFIAIGAGAAGASAVAYERHHHKPPESPDRP
jgi:hypothetical protein